jgi:GNAT superfamily N-acetyltransferase
MPSSTQLIRITRHSLAWHRPFFDHVRTVFPGADFEEWAQAGCWTNRYDVLALVAGRRIVATTARTRMVLSLGAVAHDGGFRTLREGVQLGAVGVRPEYRGEGLGRRLIGLICQEAERANHPVFLFSNRDARGFYTRLGFTGTECERPILDLSVRPSARASRQLDPRNAEDRRMIADAVASTSSHRGGLAARTDLSILLWYLFNAPVRALELAKGRSIAFVEEEPDGTCAIREWLGERPKDIVPLLPQLIPRPTTRFAFGFIPPAGWSSRLSLVRDAETHLFLRGLPEPSRPLCFPELLRT